MPSGLSCQLSPGPTQAAGRCSLNKPYLDAGAKDNGPPGLRQGLLANWLRSFVADPHGIEAVCHFTALTVLIIGVIMI